MQIQSQVEGSQADEYRMRSDIPDKVVLVDVWMHHH